MEIEQLLILAVLGIFANIIVLVIYFEMKDRSFFKRENWKLQKANIMNLNRLDLRQLEKKYGLGKGKITEPKTETNWLDILSKLDKDKISNLLELLPNSDQGDEGSDMIGTLADFAQKNPALVQGFLDKIKPSTGDQAEQTFY